MHRAALPLAALTLTLGSRGDAAVSSGSAATPAPPPAPTAVALRPPARGVTTIVGIVNKTTGRVVVRSWEVTLHDALGTFTPTADVPAGATAPWKGRVPWCANQQDFTNKHYITVKADAPAKLYYVWQSNENWQDRIRFHVDPWWKPQATPIAGASDVDGERILEINADGTLYLRRP